MLKKGDYKLFIFLAIVIVVLFGVQYIQSTSSNVVAQVFVNGELKHSIILSEVKESYLIEINNTFKSIIEVDIGRIRVKESECNGQYCVNSGWIDKTGQIIACVPNAVIVKIIGGSEIIDSITY